MWLPNVVNVGLAVGAVGVIAIGSYGTYALFTYTFVGESAVANDADDASDDVLTTVAVAVAGTVEVGGADLAYGDDLEALKAEWRAADYRAQIAREARLRRHTPPDAEELDLLTRFEIVCMDLTDPAITDAYVDAGDVIVRRYRDVANTRIDVAVAEQLAAAELAPWEELHELGYDVDAELVALLEEERVIA